MTATLARRPRRRLKPLPTSEDRISLKEAGAKMNPARPYTTLYKWATEGRDGVLLECERQVGLLFTSPEAVERFLRKTGQ